MVAQAATVLFCLLFLTTSWAQQIAKQKCLEYATLVKNDTESVMCKAFTDKNTGVKIEPNEFPATAMLGYTVKEGEVRYLCDATLISPDTLLAAGHCLHQKAFGKPTWVRIGATHSTLGIEVEVKESLCHPQYRPGNDIALVKLKQQLNSTFVPACLNTDEVEDGTQGIGVGRPIGSVYIELREKCPIKSWLEVKPIEDCMNAFSQQNINISSETMLCTKDPANGPGDCLSGPLYVSSESCVLKVAGIASFGKPCHSESATGRLPSVYTKVSHYIPWIESIAWPAS